MVPFLQPGMNVVYSPVRFEQLRKGDLLFFKDSTRKNNQIVHRVIQVNIDKREVITKGDNSNKFDIPVKEDRILGKVVKILKENQVVYLESPQAKMVNKIFLFYSLLTYRIPILTKVLRGRKFLIKIFLGYW